MSIDEDISGVGTRGDSIEPVGDQSWRIETNGINHIPDADRHGEARDLFWVWAAANVSILSVTYGSALVVFFHLNLVQGIIGGAVGTIVSFVLVGLVGLAGQRAGAPTMVISRAAFGVRGNYLPTLVSYLSFIGWEIVVTTLAVQATQTVLQRLNVGTGNFTIAISFAVIAVLGVGVVILGHSTIVKVQRMLLWAFGALTIVFMILEWKDIHWHAVSSLHAGSFANLVGGASIILAGLGLGYVNGGADYTRYLPKRTSGASTIGWTVLGASFVPIILMIYGIFLTASDTSLATAANPIGALSASLPTWFLVPYMITAAGGLMAATLINMYSSGLSLMALGVRLPRYQTVLVDTVLMAGGCTYFLFFSTNFFANLEGYLVVLGVPIAAWCAIFIVDLLMNRKDGYEEADFYRPSGVYGSYRSTGLSAMIIGSVVGLGLITSGAPGVRWVGYLLGAFGGKTGTIGTSSIGIAIAFFIGGVVYIVVTQFAGHTLHDRRLPIATTGK
jgi:nucleobase:cation symporter-1, NCS1 family